jgi:cytochrome c-type biogenesis protein
VALEITLTGAALAGLLSFFTPCVLPMVPFYLCYMAGLSMAELRSDAPIGREVQRRLVIASIFFALGVTTIFVLLGLGASAAGQAFRAWMDELTWVAAGVLVIFGLHFLGILRIPLLYREARMQAPDADPSSAIGAYVMGLAFGFGWSPCVGPALAAILFLASGMGDPARGGVLLLVYGLAMTLPFVIAAIFARPFLGWMQRNRRYLAHAERVMGVMLIVFAILIVTNSIGYLAEALIRWVPAFGRMG